MKITLIIVSVIVLAMLLFGFATDGGVIGGGGITGAGDSRPTGVVTPGYTGIAATPTAAPYPEPYPMIGD